MHMRTMDRRLRAVNLSRREDKSDLGSRAEAPLVVEVLRIRVCDIVHVVQSLAVQSGTSGQRS